MTYADGRRIHDFDSHIMEPLDWLESYADPDVRALLRPVNDGNAERVAFIDGAVEAQAARVGDAAANEALESELMHMKNKGYLALGAFDPDERIRAMDLLGFEQQLLFPTVSFPQFAYEKDPVVRIGGARAMNRGLADYGRVDARLWPVGYVPLGVGVEAAAPVLEEALKDGCRVIAIDMVPDPDGLSFTHADYDPIWARLQEAGTPIAIHVGVHGPWGKGLPAGFHNNGRPHLPQLDDAPREALPFMSISHPAELFLAALVFDGVLERFPGLRVAVAELGATWVPAFLRMLDHSQRAFRRIQPQLSELSLKPSEYIRRQVKFSPFAGEPVGWMIEEAGDELFAFASDYPHHEGTDDPIRRFDQTLEGTPAESIERFYRTNFEELFGL
ncbi:MAG: amidohydrolase family protein [Myxococcota bacterium]|nr:amidohydrolase family protein [Myxococcota bacterium]